MKKEVSKSVALYWFAALVAGVLLAVSAYRPDETGIWTFDIRWIADAIHELQTALLGLLVSGLFIWALPLNWSDAKNDKLPIAVRGLSPIALAIVVWAILSAVGRM